MRREGMPMTALRLLAVLLTALALVPSAAHLFELPNKIGLGREQYFTVQAIYRGWILFAIVVSGALAANASLAIALRARRRPFGSAAAAALLIAATLAVFFVWTFPANQATADWTVVPEDWAALRVRWEYSHAVNAVLAFGSLCGIVWANLAPGAPDSRD
jgi:hypothetical protein